LSLLTFGYPCDKDHILTQNKCVCIGTFLNIHPVWCIMQSMSHQPRNCDNIPFFFTTNHTDRTFFLCRLHLALFSHLDHSSFCCVERGRANTQSFTLWQKATMEITLMVVCLQHLHTGTILHILLMVLCTFNAALTERLQQ